MLAKNTHICKGCVDKVSRVRKQIIKQSTCRSIDLATAAMDLDLTIEPLSSVNIPELTEITSTEALAYVGQSLEELIRSHELDEAGESEGRRSSFAEAVERVYAAFQAKKPNVPVTIAGNSNKRIKRLQESVVQNNNDPEVNEQTSVTEETTSTADNESSTSEETIKTELHQQKLQIDELYRKFWSKEEPPISVDAYLKRFHRYCPSSAASYLMAGSLLYMISIDLRMVPISRRNVYRLFAAAFLVSAKLVEDKLYSMKRYATTAGVTKADSARLEISFLLLIDFNSSADRDVLTANLVNWGKLNEQEQLMAV